MSRRKWTLLYQIEDQQKAWLYEQLQWHDLKDRIRDGWEPVKERKQWNAF
ncbi:MAG: hypothetical protein ACE3JK_10575 [Sporolactobacillus sp.]